jgi:hypothetical protein
LLTHDPTPTQTRGNQRELDRAKAQKLQDKHKGPPQREGTPQSRNEKDAAALKAKLEAKAAAAAAAAAGGGGGGGGGGKK